MQSLCHLPETKKTEFGQVKIVKEYVWINRKKIYLDFGQEGEKIKSKTAIAGS